MEIVEEKQEYVTLNIRKNATSKDIQKVWSGIRKKLNGDRKRKKESGNMKRDLKILQLKEQGLKAKEIVALINSDENFAQHKIPYQEISRIVKRLKTKSKKNMPHKDS